MSKKMQSMAFKSPPSTFSDEPKARFNHRTLLADYENLYKETYAAKMKLRKLNQRKLTLLAEVQFLRRRYKFLMKGQIPNQAAQETQHKPKSIMKPKNHARKQVLNQKRVCSSVEAVMRNPKPPVFDLNQISREEEAVPVNCCEQIMEMNVPGSGCRNALKSSSGGTRKKKMISWQDQVRVL